MCLWAQHLTLVLSACLADFSALGQEITQMQNVYCSKTGVTVSVQMNRSTFLERPTVKANK